MSSQSYIFNPTERTSAAAGDGFSAPRLTTTDRNALSLGVNGKGMMVYDTTLTTLCIWNGTAWEFISDNSNGFISVKDFGAKGDGVTDDTDAIQAAINYTAPLGNTLYFPTGTYIVNDRGAGYCLLIQYPIQILGAGAFYTAINPSASVPIAVDIIRISPSVAYASDFTSIEKIQIGNPSTGTRTGKDGIFCFTNAVGQYLPKFTLRDVYIGTGNGYGFRHFNNETNNPNGGMYAALIDNCTIKGGLKLDSSGDSIVISNCILSGPRIGVDAALVTGASLLSILDNNITNDGGAIKIDRGLNIQIQRNNIENYAAGASNNAVIDINAASGTFTEGVIGQNLVAAFGATTATTLIRIRNANGTLIQDNSLLSGFAGVISGVNIATSTSIRIGSNSFNANVTSKVVDAGNGTMGVVKTPTLVNSWVIYSAADVVTFYKSPDGVININGTIKNGTTAYGTPLFTLPIGFRPATGQVKRFGVYTLNPGITMGSIEIDDAGTVYITSGGATLLNLSGIVFNAESFDGNQV